MKMKTTKMWTQMAIPSPQSGVRALNSGKT